jgi:transcriptional regulator with XRE-family HTH domain
MAKTQHTRRYKHLLAELRAVRKAAKVTQLAASKKLGKHAPHISKIESGERRLDVIELADLCKIYGISLSKFLKRAGIE